MQNIIVTLSGEKQTWKLINLICISTIQLLLELHMHEEKTLSGEGQKLELQVVVDPHAINIIRHLQFLITWLSAVKLSILCV